MTTRDDFPAPVVRALRERVGNRCSLCRRPTSGPHTDPARSVNAGQAAHITAAAEGGPRYDAALTPAERSGAGNGIWLCAIHATLVDRDEVRFPVDELRRIKEAAERATADALYDVVADAPPPEVSISALPDTGQLFLGRTDELAFLGGAWNDTRCNVAVVHAWGGMGKTALVQAWLRELASDGFGGTRRVFAWSFYSQNTDRTISADPFLGAALEWFAMTIRPAAPYGRAANGLPVS